MKNKNSLLAIFTGAITILSGFVMSSMHSMLLYIAFSTETSLLRTATLLIFIACGIVQIFHGCIIISSKKLAKPKKISFKLNIIIIVVSAIAILLSVICTINLMPIQVMTGIVVPVMYFAAQYITAK